MEVRETYLNKKNMCLRRPDDNSHQSFICSIEAVNEVYNKVQCGVAQRDIRSTSYLSNGFYRIN